MPTSFQDAVYRTLEKIPEGSVSTYGAVAAYLGTKGVRAVATAVGKNPYAPKVPCHRVVPADGRIGNYSGEGGVERKTELLRQEGVHVEKGRIKDFEERMYDFGDLEERVC